MGYGRELLKGSTDHLLLSLIRQEPMYGYQLIKEIGKRSRGYFEFKQGTCYTALHRLEREGLIEGKWKRISNGHARRYCYLSLLGRDGVEAKWIAASELEGQLREDLGDGHFSRHVARRIG